MQRIRVPVLARSGLRAAGALLTPLAACSGGTAPPPADGGVTDDCPAVVSVTPEGRRVTVGEPVEVTAERGSLTSVTATDAEGGRLDGRFSADRTSWISNRKTVPGAAYRGTAATRSKGGTIGTRRASFTTADADKVDKVDWRPRTHWKPGTGVTLKAELNGTDSGHAHAAP
ncbi:Ig-like domain-containing protein [Streptomyces cadmiisoli]|uniref:Ig-like domain-containing protein n=1 Tax=Streptomyces cadmiisoli TaxID=2184053 RepID=UPI003667FB69